MLWDLESLLEALGSVVGFSEEAEAARPLLEDASAVAVAESQAEPRMGAASRMERGVVPSDVWAVWLVGAARLSRPLQPQQERRGGWDEQGVVAEGVKEMMAKL